MSAAAGAETREDGPRGVGRATGGASERDVEARPTMITEKTVDEETVLEVTTVEDFGRALMRGVPVVADKTIRDAYGLPDDEDNTDSREDVDAAAWRGGEGGED